MTSAVNIIIPSPPTDYQERSYYFGYSAAHALTTVHSLLSSYGQSPEEIKPFPAKYAHGRLEENLVLIGGPLTNKITQRIMQDSEFPFSFANYTLVDRHNGKTYEPRVEQDRVQTDYGFVLRRPNPYKRGKTLVIIAGCHGYGTYAGSRVVTDNDSLRKITRKVKGRSCGIVVKCDVVQDAVVQPSIIYVFEIASEPTTT